MQIHTAPPSFQRASTRRQRARAAGLNPDYWYPCTYGASLPDESTLCVPSGGGWLTLHRAACGRLSAENLDGPVPVKERYGLVWVFPGDPARSEQRDLPFIPELSQPDGWAHVLMDVRWRCHYSIALENICDLSHAYLHRRYRPFDAPQLISHEASMEQVVMRYEARFSAGRLGDLVMPRREGGRNQVTITYAYPYEHSDLEGLMKHWCFLLPLDDRSCRLFFLFYFNTIQLPRLGLTLRLHRFMGLMRRFVIYPVLREDRLATEAEQEGYEAHFQAPACELNPIIAAIQDLNIRKWSEHLIAPAR